MKNIVILILLLVKFIFFVAGEKLLIYPSILENDGIKKHISYHKIDTVYTLTELRGLPDSYLNEKRFFFCQDFIN